MSTGKPSYQTGKVEGASVAESELEERGLDTMNRVLMTAARHHKRDAVFMRWEKGRQGDWSWHKTPDWRADRNSIRVALVLRQRIELILGERVALWLPLGVESAVIERGVWSIGAVSVPVWPDWDLERVSEVLRDAEPAVLFASDYVSAEKLRVIDGLPESVRVIVPLEGEPADSSEALTFEKFMEYGGVLDTAERASMWRTTGRSAKPEHIITWEYGWGEEGLERGVLDHRTMLAAIETVGRLFPRGENMLQLVASDQPAFLLRALTFAGWSDGNVITTFAPSPAEWERVGRLKPNVVTGAVDALAAVREALRTAGELERLQEEQSSLSSVSKKRGRPDGERESPLHVLIMDGSEPDESASWDPTGRRTVNYYRPEKLGLPPVEMEPVPGN